MCSSNSESTWGPGRQHSWPSDQQVSSLCDNTWDVLELTATDLRLWLVCSCKIMIAWLIFLLSRQQNNTLVDLSPGFVLTTFLCSESCSSRICPQSLSLKTQRDRCDGAELSRACKLAAAGGGQRATAHRAPPPPHTRTGYNSTQMRQDVLSSEDCAHYSCCFYWLTSYQRQWQPAALTLVPR